MFGVNVVLMCHSYCDHTKLKSAFAAALVWDFLWTVSLFIQMCRFTSPFLSFLMFVWMLDSYGWLTPRSDLLKRHWLAKGSNLKGSLCITIHIFAEQVASESGDTFVFNDIGKDPKQTWVYWVELWLWVTLWHVFLQQGVSFLFVFKKLCVRIL